MREFALDNVKTSNYTSIALDNYYLALNLIMKAETLEHAICINEKEDLMFNGKVLDQIEVVKEMPNFELSNILSKIQDSFTITCVFASMALESFIYDYGVTSNIEKYMKKDLLDRLDLYAKYVVIPRMVTGRDIDIGDNAFCLLKKTISNRNNLIHAKSKLMREAIPDSKSLEYDCMAKTALQTIYQMAALIDSHERGGIAKSFFMISGFHCSEGYKNPWKEFIDKTHTR